jgi:hypothetical protein
VVLLEDLTSNDVVAVASSAGTLAVHTKWLPNVELLPFHLGRSTFHLRRCCCHWSCGTPSASASGGSGGGCCSPPASRGRGAGATTTPSFGRTSTAVNLTSIITPEAISLSGVASLTLGLTLTCFVSDITPLLFRILHGTLTAHTGVR